MSAYHSEWSALVREILWTAEFRRAPLRGELLRYLFANIHKPHGISRKTLAAEVFKSVRYDEGAVGERCLDLRNALREYAESGAGQVQTWRCELPPAVPSEGYRLRFVNRVGRFIRSTNRSRCSTEIPSSAGRPTATTFPNSGRIFLTRSRRIADRSPTLKQGIARRRRRCWGCCR